SRAKKRSSRADALVVGINPMPVFDSRYWFEHDDVRYRAYVSKLAELAARLERENCRVFFFPTMWRDNDVIRDVLEALESRGGGAQVRRVAEVGELMGVLQEADIVVSTRFHGIVLPYHAGIPLLGIGYFRKT